MPSPLETNVRAALDSVTDPLTGKGLVASGRVSGLVARADEHEQGSEHACMCLREILN